MFPTSFTSKTKKCTLKEHLDGIFLFLSLIASSFLHNHFYSGHVQILFEAILFLEAQDLMSLTFKCVTVEE